MMGLFKGFSHCMDNENLNGKISTAAKWSTITELIARVATPFVQVVLARLLTPEAFGAVATVTMVISFAELFTEAGFQKFIIQHRFLDDKEKYDFSNVAFWSNLLLSILIWCIISLNAESISILVGSPGLHFGIVVACCTLVFNALSSIQIALFKRSLDFKTLFKTRLASVIIPFIITIPLAFVFRSYWALILGSLSLSIANSTILFIYSKWKPRLYYSVKKLKTMLSFTIWTLFETISIWLTTNIDIFIIGQYLNAYYLGLYKVSLTTVAQITNIIVATVTPIMFSSLSRVQNQPNYFQHLFLKIQRLTAVIICPICCCILAFRDTVVFMLLGSQWQESAFFIGIWGGMTSLTISICYLCSEAYRAKGKPILSTIIQISHILFLAPVMIYTAQIGYNAMCIGRTVLIIQFVFAHLLCMKLWLKFNMITMLSNVMPSATIALVLTIPLLLLQNHLNNFLISIICLVLYVFSYLCLISNFRKEKTIISGIIRQLSKSFK